MGTILRPASPALKAALSGGVPLIRADLFTFTLVDGVTVYTWTSFDQDLAFAGSTFQSKNPWLWRSKWNVTNTMEVPQLTVYLAALGPANIIPGFGMGVNFIQQIHNGLFDGASHIFERVYMPTPGDTTTYGGVGLFTGEVGPANVDGLKAELTIKGRTNKLDQYFPRNRYQTGCNHAFCDAGCTLSRVSFTASFTVGSSPAPSSTFIPWTSAPATPSLYIGGTLTISGSQRNIAFADSTGLKLAYPLYAVPAPGTAFTAFQGCDKTFNSGSGRSCTDHSNTANYDGFEFVPPPNMGI